MALLINQATPQDADAANTLGSAVRAFKTAILDIFTITDNTTITNAPFSISTAGLVTILRSPFTVTGHAASGGAKALIVTPGAHTAVTAEVIDLDFQAHTNTITGTYATQRFANFAQPTMTATAAYTITTAATVNIAGPCHPTGAGPVTITNDYALRLEQATVTASAATTIDTCAALVIEGAPIRGTNVTITNTYAQLLKESGAKTLASIVGRIENTATSSTDSIDKIGLSITSTGTWNGASANNIGIDIGAITGGTNNYSLRCAQAIQSTLATGTAPLVVASTTKVTNLNADLLDGYNSSATAAATVIPVTAAGGTLDAGFLTSLLVSAGSGAGTVAANAGTATTAARSDHVHFTNTAARAYQSAAAQAIVTATYTKVTLDVESYDVGSNFASNKYTVPTGQDGYYQINGHVEYNDTLVDQTTYRCLIYKNGSVILQDLGVASGTVAVSARISDIVYLVATDYIELYTYHNAGADKNLSNNSTSTFLSIIRVG